MSKRNTKNQLSNSGPSNTDVGTEAEQLARRLRDVQVPVANVMRTMLQILPSHARIPDNTKEAVQKLVSYFINRITKLANERCHGEQRKTVAAEDILWAMNKIGLTNYVGPLTRYLHKYREQDADRFFNTRRGNIVRPNYELALAPPIPSVPVRPINSASNSSYEYPCVTPTGLFYDPAAADVVNGFTVKFRNEETVGNDDDPAESSSSSATNYGLPEVNDPYGQFGQ